MASKWTGEVLSSLPPYTVIDQAFTKTTGVATDGLSTIWLVDLGGERAVLKRTTQFYRSLRCQIFIDELKPWFGLERIGCLLVAPPQGRPTLLMRFVGTGQSLASQPIEQVLSDQAVVDTLGRIALLDVVTANSSRKTRNILWVPPSALVAIDEEQALDFPVAPEFRMAHAVRRHLVLTDVDAVLDPLLAPDIHDQWLAVAMRYYQSDHARAIVHQLTVNVANGRARFFRYLDTRYGASTRAGVLSRTARGPTPWERVP